MTDQDTREQLEADIHRAADDMEAFTFGERFINTHKIIRWLDRQAAITEREAIERWDDKALAMYYAALDRAHGAEAERDELQSKLDQFDGELYYGGSIVDWYDLASKYEDERDELEKRVVDLQSELDDRDMLERDSAYMRLPSDADGVPIRVGDWVERVGGGNDYAKVAKCVAVAKDDVLFKGKNIVGNAPETLIKQNKAFNWRRCLVNADGEVIRKGDFVWGEDGRKWLVTGFDWEHTHPVCAEDENGHTKQLKPSWCSHTPPDSLKRIAEELREIGADTYRHSGTADLDVIADRIERLM